MSEGTPIDRHRVRAAFDRAATTYDAVAVLQREVGQRIAERLDGIRLQPTHVLDLGCGTGTGTAALMRRYSKACTVALDLAPAMVAQARRQRPWFRRFRGVCADAESLPFAAASFDLIHSNLLLQWLGEPDAVFGEVLRCLRPEGLWLFSTLGPDTLTELRQSWAMVDDRPHVHDFLDLHDIGDALVRAGFRDTVVDVERITLRYPDVRTLMHDLKGLGAGNLATGRRNGLTGKRRLLAMIDAYERRRGADGSLPATYEVVYGLGWAPPATTQRRQADGSIAIPLTALRRPGMTG